MKATQKKTGGSQQSSNKLAGFCSHMLLVRIGSVYWVVAQLWRLKEKSRFFSILSAVKNSMLSCHSAKQDFRCSLGGSDSFTHNPSRGLCVIILELARAFGYWQFKSKSFAFDCSGVKFLEQMKLHFLMQSRIFLIQNLQQGNKRCLYLNNN